MLRRVPRWIVAVLLIVVIGGLLTACGSAEDYPQTTLESAGPHNDSILGVYSLVWYGSIIVFFLVEGLLIFSVFKFRGQPKTAHGRPVPVHGNNRLEIIWTVIPAIILAIIAVPTLQVISELSEAPGDDAMVINVIGHQFFWEFQYPDLGVNTTNELHIPVGQRIDLRLDSADVIHSFWVPQLAGKTDAIPGRDNRMWFEADAPGTYLGQCAEFCGLAHYQMLMTVVADTQEDFDAWVAEELAPPPAEGDPEEGLAIVEAQCAACHAIEGTSAQGQVGPALTGFANQELIADVIENTPENLAAWLDDPQAIKPGTAMPNLPLSEADIINLVTYLETLNGESE
ncbi:cytochrome c oxidase subunit II [soil metagenome]